MLVAASGVIFDVDGVLLDAPHSDAWRLAAAALCSRAGLPPLPSGRAWGLLYATRIAGRPRADGARALLWHLGIADRSGTMARELAATKNGLFLQLVGEGRVRRYEDAWALASACHAHGMKCVLASSSRNAGILLSLLTPSEAALFDADVSASTVRGKPAPDLFLAAAQSIGLPPSKCLVIEDAPSGIAAARAAHMAVIAVDRFGFPDVLLASGPDLCVASLFSAAELVYERADVSERGRGLGCNR